MPVLEIILLLWAAVGAVALERGRGRLPGWAFGVVAGLLLAAELAGHGLHWQLFPADFVLLLCAVLLGLGRPAAGSAGAKLLCAGGLVLVVGSLAMALALPLFHLPAPTGPYAVGTRTEDWTDPSTGRELVVQLWYPAAPGSREPLAPYMRLRETKPVFRYWAWLPTNSRQDAAVASTPPAAAAPATAATPPGGFPLLLFGHMWDGRRTQDTFLTEDLASHGFVVVSVDHPGNAARVQMADGHVERSDRADALNNLEAAGFGSIRVLWAGELRLWTADNEYVLNALQGGRVPELAGRLDWTAVGAFGHSFGGSASVALLGRDPRVKSALDLDGWTFDGLDDRTGQPVLFVYEAADAARAGAMPPGTSVDDQLERSDRAVVDRSLASGGAERMYVGGTQHADFTDATLISPLRRLRWTGPIRPERVQRITRGLVLSFFNRTLRAGASGMPAYPEVRTESSPVAAVDRTAQR